MTDARDYELLVKAVIEQIAQFNGVDTLRLEHDVKVSGLSTSNQVDVLWEFRDDDGEVMRVVVEARHLGRRVDQGRLHAFRSVIDDVAYGDATTRGVMITTVGYQSGAKQIAAAYGIGILELREPMDADWAGMIRTIRIDIQAQTPSVTNIDLRPDPTWRGTPRSVAGHTEEIRLGEQSLHSFMYGEFLVGHAAGLGEVAEKRRIHVTFEPPRLLEVAGEDSIPIVEISADYEEVPLPASRAEIDATANVAWVLLDSLRHTRAWGMKDGRIRISPKRD